MTTTTEQMRAWSGPAILTFGFRLFFFGAAVWAALAMALWVLMLSGRLMFPTAFDPLSWHAHEFLFGYLDSVVAGFLLTAVPNWTGRLPIAALLLGYRAWSWRSRDELVPQCFLPFQRMDHTIKPWDQTRRHRKASTRVFC
jgi:uncharacterized protein involved in response to NO